MQNKTGRSNTYDIIQNNYLDYQLNIRKDFLKNKKSFQLKLHPKSFKEQLFSIQQEEQKENENLIKFDDFHNLQKKNNQSKNKALFKLPIIFKDRSKSSQVKSQNQQNSNSDAEIMSNIKQEKISMRPLFKSINQILSKRSQKPILQKIITESENEKNCNDQSILKLQEFLNQKNIMNLGKYVQDKIEEKRMKNFRMLYKNTAKYQSDEEDSSVILSVKEQQKIEEIKNRRQFIIKMAQKKSPKFIYPLGPKIRVPNLSLENQYFQIQQNLSSRAQGYQFSPKNRKIQHYEDEISIQKLDSPPKDKFFPTSSMQEDYLNIKVQQIVRSLL